MSNPSIKKEKDGSITFEFTLNWKKIQEAYQKVLQKAAKHAEIKGFRKGKAPLEIAEKHLKKDKLYNQAIQNLLPDKYLEKIKELKLKPISQPQITPLKMDEGKDWEFKVDLAEKPEFKLKKYEKKIKSALEKLKQEFEQKKSSSEKEPESQLKQKLHNQKIEKVFDSLLDLHDFKLSEVLIKQEVQKALNKLQSQLKQLNVKLEDYLKSVKKTREELLEDYEKTTQDRLKLELILDKIIKKEKPEVSQKELKKLTQERKLSEHQLENIKYSLKKQKTIDRLLEL